jgi:hypothetical protein
VAVAKARPTPDGVPTLDDKVVCGKAPEALGVEGRQGASASESTTSLGFYRAGSGGEESLEVCPRWGASSVPDTSTVTWGQKEMHGARCQSRLRDRGRFLPRILVRLPQPDIQRQRGVKRRNREMNALESCLAPLQCGWSLWTGTGGEGRGTALLMTGSTRPPLGVGHCRAPQRGECASARIVST